MSTSVQILFEPVPQGAGQIARAIRESDNLNAAARKTIEDHLGTLSEATHAYPKLFTRTTGERMRKQNFTASAQSINDLTRARHAVVRNEVRNRK